MKGNIIPKIILRLTLQQSGDTLLNKVLGFVDVLAYSIENSMKTDRMTTLTHFSFSSFGCSIILLGSGVMLRCQIVHECVVL